MGRGDHPRRDAGLPVLKSFPLRNGIEFTHRRVYSEYNEGQILQKLSRVFADASHGLREDMILGLGPALKIIREVRPAPGRAFIAGLLGFDDACKYFEENSNRNAELSTAYAKIEVSPPILPHSPFKLLTI